MKFKSTIICLVILFATTCFAASDYLGGTFLGSTSKDSVLFVKVANSGDVYISGTVGDLTFDGIDGYDTTFDSKSNAILYIAKFDKDLKELKAFTYIGDDYYWPIDFKIGDNGDIYLLTKAFDLGLSNNINGYDTTYVNSGEMLIRLSPDLKEIKNYTYLYNTATYIESFNFNKNGDIIFTGYKYVFEDGGNTVNYKIFVGIMSSDLTQLKNSYVYGTNDNKKKLGTSLYIGKDGYIYLLGYSNSKDFPSENIALSGEAYEEHNGKIFISKFDSNLQLVKTSYIANGFSKKAFIGDNEGNLFLSFRTNSTVFNHDNEKDFYPIILKINSDLTKIENNFYTDYYPGQDYIYALKCDKDGFIYAGGSTVKYGNKFHFPFMEGVWYAEQSSNSVGMLLVLNNDLSKLLYATVIGGSYGADSINDLDITSNKTVYVAGYAQTLNFPVGDKGYQTSCVKGTGNSCDDGFVVRFAPFAVDSLPLSLSVKTLGSHVKITWSENSHYSGYMLYYAPYPYTGTETIGSVDIGNINSLEFDLWQGAAFYVAVRPYDDSGKFGNFSNIGLIEIK